MAYKVDYNDERFAKVESDKNAALKDVDNTYDPMINDSTQHFDEQIEAVKQWGETQKQNQQDQTDFAIEKIEQQKEQAHKDYLKEQSGAYVDWQKQSNDYGSNAEKMADSGLAHTGYSESSQVAMYNQYQNRVAVAREAYTRAVLNYDNAIKDARLQNNSVLAEIAYNTLQKSLELGMQGLQYKNSLVIEKANVKREVENNHYNRYENVLNHIYHEMSQAEQIRQYNETQAEQKRQFNETLALQKKNSSASGGSSRSSGSRSSSSSKGKSGSSGSSYQSSKAPTKSKATATDYYNTMVSSGATKSQVVGDINRKVQSGVITKQQAAQLKKVFNPRGYTY